MNRSILLGVLVLVVAGVGFLAGEAVVHVGIRAGLFALALLGLTVLTGATGTLSFAQAAWMVVGGVATAVVTMKLELIPVVGLLLGLVVTLGITWVTSAMSARLTKRIFPFVTLAIACGVAVSLLAVRKFGLVVPTTAPNIELFGYEFASSNARLLVVWVCVVAAAWMLTNLRQSRHGRIARALGSGDIMADSVGRRATHARRAVAMLTAAIACFAGWLAMHTGSVAVFGHFSLWHGLALAGLAYAVVGDSIAGAIVAAISMAAVEAVLARIVPVDRSGLIQFAAVVIAAALIFWSGQRLGSVPLPIPRWLRKALPYPLPQHIDEQPAFKGHGAPPVGAASFWLRGVSAEDGKAGVREINVAIHTGEIVAFVGSDYASARVLLDVLSGRIPVTTGSVELWTTSVASMSMHDFVRHGVARAFSPPPITTGMSVLEHVALGATGRATMGRARALLRLNGAEERKLFSEAMHHLTRVGMREHARSDMASMSPAQQCLAEIARALAADAAVILIDTPSIGLTRDEKRSLQVVLTGLRASGLSIVLAEHDIDFALKVANRVVVIDQDMVIADGAPETVRGLLGAH